MTVEFLSAAELLKLYRERGHLSQRQLAARLNLDPSLISRWENQMRVPGDFNVQRIAQVLGLQEEQQQNLIDARDNVGAEVLALHELLSLYLDRTRLTETDIIARIGEGTKDKLRAWRTGMDIPTNAQLLAIAQALEFDEAQFQKLSSAKPRMFFTPEAFEFVLLGSGQVHMDQLTELMTRGVEIVMRPVLS